tara:strand:+ start:382 stop:561 length:180 start_codon:yes stop_codon:yes gene_type:complete
MLTIRERLNNPGVVRVYLQMIRNDPVDIVKDLRKTLKDNAEGHAKQILLEEEIVKRLGA